MFVSEVSKLDNIQSEAKAKNEQNSLDLVVHLNEHSILRNIDDGKVDMFRGNKQSQDNYWLRLSHSWSQSGFAVQGHHIHLQLQCEF